MSVNNVRQAGTQWDELPPGGISRGLFSIITRGVFDMLWTKLWAKVDVLTRTDAIRRELGALGHYETVAICIFDGIRFVHGRVDTGSVSTYVLERGCRDITLGENDRTQEICRSCIVFDFVANAVGGIGRSGAGGIWNGDYEEV